MDSSVLSSPIPQQCAGMPLIPGYSEELIQVLQEECEINVTKISKANLDKLYQDCFHELGIYLKHGGTMSREILMDAIADSLIGKSWIRHNDCEESKAEFNELVKPYRN